MLDAFQLWCLSVKLWLDSNTPGGSLGVLFFIGLAFDTALRRAGFVEACSRVLGDRLAGELVSSGPTVVILTFWGWATTGRFVLSEATIAFCEGVAGPALLAWIANKRPPQSPPRRHTTLISGIVLALALAGCTQGQAKYATHTASNVVAEALDALDDATAAEFKAASEVKIAELKAKCPPNEEGARPCDIEELYLEWLESIDWDERRDRISRAFEAHELLVRALDGEASGDPLAALVLIGETLRLSAEELRSHGIPVPEEVGKALAMVPRLTEVLR